MQMQMRLGQIADMVEGRVQGNKDKLIRRVAPFEAAGADDLTLARDAKYLKRLTRIRAGAIIVPKDVQVPGHNLVQVENPPVAFAKVLSVYYQPSIPYKGISPMAFIGQNFSYDREVTIAPFCTIGNDVHIGRGSILHPGVVIEDQAVIGSEVVIYPNVTVGERCRIGNGVIIHSGTVIGSDGYGFAPQGQTYVKIPQTGIVQIDDDVEIGACNAIDRATFGKTWIQRGVKTDNLIHIGHNVTVGEDTALVAQVGISGSVTIGQHVIIAGQAGIAGHLTIGDNAIIGARGGISKSVAPGDIRSGAPSMPHKLWLKVRTSLPKLPDILKRLSKLEKRLCELEKQSPPS
jgi:UDP-3-O-[3-hydroxymyristoyl] glucosamine N-acyltransferase